VCGRPFFPRVLEQLVGLDFGIRPGRPGQPDPGQVLQAVPQLQQVETAAAQLAGQLGSGRALGDAAGDEHQFGGAAWVPCRAVPVQALKTRPQAQR
jgi:hypothetical protein